MGLYFIAFGLYMEDWEMHAGHQHELPNSQITLKITYEHFKTNYEKKNMAFFYIIPKVPPMMHANQVRLLAKLVMYQYKSKTS